MDLLQVEGGIVCDEADRFSDVDNANCFCFCVIVRFEIKTYSAQIVSKFFFIFGFLLSILNLLVVFYSN